MEREVISRLEQEKKVSVQFSKVKSQNSIPFGLQEELGLAWVDSTARIPEAERLEGVRVCNVASFPEDELFLKKQSERHFTGTPILNNSLKQSEQPLLKQSYFLETTKSDSSQEPPFSSNNFSLSPNNKSSATTAIPPANTTDTSIVENLYGTDSSNIYTSDKETAINCHSRVIEYLPDIYNIENRTDLSYLLSKRDEVLNSLETLKHSFPSSSVPTEED
jgi:hypothetical protein